MRSLKSISKTPLALMIGGMLLATGQAVVAADATSNLTPEILIKFSGDDETSNHWGKLPFTPPVLGNDGLLYGVTQSGGEVVIAGVVFAGLSYTYNPLTQTYQVLSMGTLGSPGSALFKNKAGDIFGGVTYSGIEPGAFYGKGLIFTQNASGATLFALPDSNATPSQDDLRPRGQIAEDDQGNLYVPIARGTNNCQDATQDSYNNLYRVSQTGDFERVINFCQFKEGGTTGSTQIHPFGSSPSGFIWDDATNNLYVMMAVSPSTLVDNVRPLAHLLRLSKATLDKGLTNNGIVDAADIELLHTFTFEAGGLPSTSDSRIGSMLLDGNWIYGTSYYDGQDGNTSRGSGTVWRINKTTGQFAVAHQFRAGAAGDITTKTADAADETADADGFQPNGMLVLAADGNIYGTTSADARTVSVATGTNVGRITPNGAGSIFRILTGESANRSDDQLEILHRFDAATEGKIPAGVSAGAIANGAQTLYGVNRSGEGDTVNGTLYSLSVPLSGTGSLTLASSGNTAVAAGETVSLNWTNPWYTQGCQLTVTSGSDSLIDLAADGLHDLAGLLARETLPQGISVTGDLASGSLSFPLRAAVTYQLVCDEPFAGYEGELESQAVAFTLKTASSGGKSGGSGSAFNFLMLLPLGLLAALRLRRKH